MLNTDNLLVIKLSVWPPEDRDMLTRPSARTGPFQQTYFPGGQPPGYTVARDSPTPGIRNHIYPCWMPQGLLRSIPPASKSQSTVLNHANDSPSQMSHINLMRIGFIFSRSDKGTKQDRSLSTCNWSPVRVQTTGCKFFELDSPVTVSFL